MVVGTGIQKTKGPYWPCSEHVLDLGSFSSQFLYLFEEN